MSLLAINQHEDYLKLPLVIGMFNKQAAWKLYLWRGWSMSISWDEDRASFIAHTALDVHTVSWQSTYVCPWLARILTTACPVVAGMHMWGPTCPPCFPVAAVLSCRYKPLIGTATICPSGQLTMSQTFSCIVPRANTCYYHIPAYFIVSRLFMTCHKQ